MRYHFWFQVSDSLSRGNRLGSAQTRHHCVPGVEAERFGTTNYQLGGQMQHDRCSHVNHIIIIIIIIIITIIIIIK